MDSNRARILDIRRRLFTGELTYDEARAEAQPIIEAMNKAGLAIATRRRRRFHGFTFTALMR